MTHINGPDPACRAYAFLSDNYWKCKFQQDTRASVHMVGTCSLGPDSGNSDTSVVDTKFRSRNGIMKSGCFNNNLTFQSRVRGVSNLRVVDASVIPEITNSNINAPVMMLAEKAAEDIIHSYRDPRRKRYSFFWDKTRTILKVVKPYTESSNR